MQVFKAFLKVLKKNSFTAVVFIAVFLAFALLTSSNKVNIETSVGVDIPVAVFDEDDTPESRAFKDFIDEKYDIIDIKNDRDVILDMLYYEEAGYAFVINKGYSEKLAAGDTEGIVSAYHVHDSFAEVVAEEVISDYIMTVKAYTAAGMSLSEAIENAGNDLLTETEVTIESFIEDEGDFSQKFAVYYRYMPYIMISAILSALCPVLMIMNRKDIRFRTNCSSVKPNSCTMQIFAGGGLFVLGVWLLFMGVGLYMYGGIFRGKAWTAVLNSALLSAIVTAMAVLVASVVGSQNILNLLVQILGLGMSFICGVFIPQCYLGKGVLAVGRFFPVYWYSKLNDMLCGDARYSTGMAVTCLLIEAGYAAALLLITLLIRRVRYSSTGAPAAAKAN